MGSAARYRRSDSGAERPSGPERSSARGATEAWETGLRYALALDAFMQYYGAFLAQAPSGDRVRAESDSGAERPAGRERSSAMDVTDERFGALLAYYASFMGQSRWALDWGGRFGKTSEQAVAMDAALPELGLPEGAWTQLKAHLVDLDRQGATGALAARYLQQRSFRIFLTRLRNFPEALEEDYRLIAAAERQGGKGRSEAGATAGPLPPSWISRWLGVQPGLEESVRAQVLTEPQRRFGESQVADLAGELQPGDLILKRREPFRSDSGLPGYWNDGALYIGTPEQRRRFFADPRMEDRFREAYPRTYALHASTAGAQSKEFVGVTTDGTALMSGQETLQAEAAAALRPRLSKIVRAEAILRAFGAVGRPYDLDPSLDSEALTGSELLYKAYAPLPGQAGIQLPSVQVLGHGAASANEFAKKFDGEFGLGGDAQHMELVWFVESQSKSNGGRTRPAGVEEFRSSWRRPQWSFVSTIASPKGDEAASERFP